MSWTAWWNECILQHNLKTRAGGVLLVTAMRTAWRTGFTPAEFSNSYRANTGLWQERVHAEGHGEST